MIFRSLRGYLFSKIKATGLKNTVFILCYIRRILSTSYEVINFIKILKGSRATRAHISNINIRKKRIEHCSRKIEKRRRKEERLSFPKPKKQIGSNKMLRDVYSHKAFPPQTCQILVLGIPVICLIH